jgi:hypothetical protein
MRIRSVDAVLIPTLLAAGKYIPLDATVEPLGMKRAAVAVDEASTVVKAPVFGVVAPTVPFMLIDAVPVRLVTTPADGVPRFGVIRVGEVLKTTLPDPVDVVTPVPPFKTGSVPDTPVVKGSPVQLVNVPLEGVPSAPPGAT